MKLAFDVAALADFREARRWYNDKAAGLGDALIAIVDAALERVAKEPLSFPQVRKHPRARRVWLERFPYALVFTIREDVVVIVALSHGKRRPGYWAKRLGPVKTSR